MKNFFIHPLADVKSERIGRDTRVWQFCVVLPGASIGSRCNICSHSFIEDDVVVGDRVTIKSGVQLWNGVRVSDDVFIGPNVSFVNDIFPRSCVAPERLLETHLARGCSIGANATILGGVTVGEYSMVGAGSVLLQDVPRGEVWAGNPARFIRSINI
jgi:UDP-2-acetamido-3-amino-2,3-dideoxy-glucuronate N-acetyltransferase